VQVYKHSSQAKYNKGIWGLDKSTEMTECMKLTQSPTFEGKYVSRMLVSGVLLNLWRVEIAFVIVRPFIIKYRERHNKDPSVKQIRAKAKQLTFPDFIYKYSFLCLENLQYIGVRQGVTAVD